jgi:hypothetical protein
MNGRPSRETVMNALFAKLVASVKTSFTADTTNTSTTLASPSSLAGLFLGLPVFGVGIPRGAVIATLDPIVTLSMPATADGSGVALTTGFLTFSRRFRWWTDVTDQPALFLRGDDEEMEYTNTVLQAQIIKAEVWIYSKAGENPDLAPEMPLNNLLDAVQNGAFAVDDRMRNRCTLGGLVEWCRIIGKIEKNPGDLDGQAIAVTPVEIIVP